MYEIYFRQNDLIKKSVNKWYVEQVFSAAKCGSI